MAKDNHHYVPQGYLRGFTIEGEKSLIWEYDKNTGKISRQPRPIGHICSEHHYYAQKNGDGSIDNESMEDAFHEIENKTPRIIKSLKSSGPGKKIELRDEDRGILSFFVALQLFRVPNVRKGIEDMHQQLIKNALDVLVVKEKDSLPKSIEELYERGDINIDIEKSISLKPIINMTKIGSEHLLEMVWSFASPARGMTFVTSDNPVYFQAPEKYRKGIGPDIGPMHPLSEITLPLRKDLLLICSPSLEQTPSQYKLLDCASVSLNKTDTRNMNKRTTLAAAQYVYSNERSEALARMIGKLRGTSQSIVA